MFLALTIYPAAACVGFIIGYELSAPTRTLRVQHALLGLGIGFVATVVSLHGVALVLGVRRRMRAGRRLSS